VTNLGQRYDIVVSADQPVDNYWIHALPASGCSSNDNPDGILAILRYEGSDSAPDPTSTPYTPSTTVCQDEQGLVPVVPRNVGTFSYGDSLDISSIPQNGIVTWNINGSSFFIDWADPTLLLVENHDAKYPSTYNVVSLDGTDETVKSFLQLS